MNKIKQVSSKRQALNSHYTRLKKELEIELKAKGEWFCFFSGLLLKEDAPFLPHHLRGRENNLLIEKEFLVPCLWQYHQMFHDVPFSKLKDEWWFDGFMKRLEIKDHDTYMKIKYKL